MFTKRGNKSKKSGLNLSNIPFSIERKSGCMNLADINFSIEETPEQRKAKQERKERRELLEEAAPYTVWDNLHDDEVLQHISFLAKFFEALKPMTETVEQREYYKTSFSVCLNLWDIILEFGMERYNFGFENLERVLNKSDNSTLESRCGVFERVQRAKTILKFFHFNGFKPFDFNKEAVSIIVATEPLEAIIPTINNILEEYEKRKDTIRTENDVPNQCYYLKKHYNKIFNPCGYAPIEPNAISIAFNGQLRGVYDYLSLDGVSFDAFSYEVCFAELSALKQDLPDWKFKCLVSNLKNLFSPEWYDAIIANLKTTKKELSKYNKVDEDWAKGLAKLCKKPKK